MKQRDMLILAGAALVGYYLYKKASPAADALGGAGNAATNFIDQLKKTAADAAAAITDLQQGGAQVQRQASEFSQDIRGQAASGLLTATGINNSFTSQEQPTYKISTLAASPSYNTVPSAITAARAVESAAVQTGFGNYQTISGAVMNVSAQPTASAVVAASRQAQATAATLNSSSPLASLMARGIV